MPRTTKKRGSTLYLVLPHEPDHVLAAIIGDSRVVGNDLPVVILCHQRQIPGHPISRNQAAVHGLKRFAPGGGIVKGERVFEIIDTIIRAGFQPELSAMPPVDIHLVGISRVVVIAEVSVFTLCPDIVEAKPEPVTYSLSGRQADLQVFVFDWRVAE